MIELRRRFDALGPWFTRFEIDGVAFGGAHSYADDPRVGLFFDWLGRPARILELGCFEGGHSVRLASPPFVERLVGLEGRPENIARARLAIEVLGRGNVEFRHVDLEGVSLAQFGHFDAVFCAGLLYHLERPWRLLEEIASVTDRLFLDTHCSASGNTTVDGYAGSHYQEGGYSDPLSGLSDTSFWLTLTSLIDALSTVGFVVRNQVVIPNWDDHGLRIHLAASRVGRT